MLLNQIQTPSKVNKILYHTCRSHKILRQKGWSYSYKIHSWSQHVWYSTKAKWCAQRSLLNKFKYVQIQFLSYSPPRFVKLLAMGFCMHLFQYFLFQTNQSGIDLQISYIQGNPINVMLFSPEGLTPTEPDNIPWGRKPMPEGTECPATSK